MEKIHNNMHVFMLSCIKHACLHVHVFSPFSAYFSPHDIIAEKGPLQSTGYVVHVAPRFHFPRSIKCLHMMQES